MSSIVAELHLDTKAAEAETRNFATRTRSEMQNIIAKGGDKKGFQPGGLLTISQFADDAQYGLKSVVNQVPLLVAAFGGGAGVAGAIQLAAVAANIFGTVMKNVTGETSKAEKELAKKEATERRAARATQESAYTNQLAAKMQKEFSASLAASNSSLQEQISFSRAFSREAQRRAQIQRDLAEVKIDGDSGATDASKIRARAEAENKAQQMRVEGDISAAKYSETIAKDRIATLAAERAAELQKATEAEKEVKLLEARSRKEEGIWQTKYAMDAVNKEREATFAKTRAEELKSSIDEMIKIRNSESESLRQAYEKQVTLKDEQLIRTREAENKIAEEEKKSQEKRKANYESFLTVVKDINDKAAAIQKKAAQTAADNAKSIAERQLSNDIKNAKAAGKDRKAKKLEEQQQFQSAKDFYLSKGMSESEATARATAEQMASKKATGQGSGRLTADQQAIAQQTRRSAADRAKDGGLIDSNKFGRLDAFKAYQEDPTRQRPAAARKVIDASPATGPESLIKPLQDLTNVMNPIGVLLQKFVGKDAAKPLNAA